MPSLENFMESLSQEQDKLVQMDTIKNKDQALATRVSNSSKGKPKSKNSKLPGKKKNPNPVMQVRILPRRRKTRENIRPNAPIATRDGI